MGYVLDIILGTLCVISFGVLLWQWIEAAQWPLHRRFLDTSFAPNVTLFKPLKNCEPRTIECLVSWLEQDYAGTQNKVQILFGVADEHDPIVLPLRTLLTRYPHANAQLFICSQNKGLNKKVSTLIQLAPHATGDIWIISDADILAPADLLQNIVQPFREPQNGAVNCLYRISAPRSPVMAFETIGVNADFWSQVTQSLRLGEQDFCLGAVIAVQAKSFLATGGFDPLANLLADDYHIGHRLHNAGKKIVLAPLVVDSITPKASFRAIWQHQLRWARTIRFERPISYGLSILSNSTLWALVWLVGGHWAGRFIIIAAVLLVRILAVADLQRRIAQGHPQHYVWMAWAKDLFQFALWVGAFTGNHIWWRGEKFRVHSGGVLSECTPTSQK